MSDTVSPAPQLLRDRSGAQRVTNIGVHPDRTGRVDRHHRRHPDRPEGQGGRPGGLRGRVRRGGRAVVAVLRSERRGGGREDRPLEDPGRLGRSAYHLIHPVMVAGIIVCAAADEMVLSDPGQAATAPAAWMTLGGPALFLAGHAAFKFVVWRVVSWPRLAGIAALALLALAARAIPALALAACTAAVVIAVAVADRLPLTPHPEGTEGPDAPEGSADPEEPDRLDPDLAAG